MDFISALIIPAQRALQAPNRRRTLAVDDEHPHTEYAELAAGTRAAVSFAEPWSEARWSLGRRPGPGDMRGILARDSSDDGHLCSSVNGLAEGDHVAGLLERCYPAVKNLAQTLYFTGTATHKDVCTALGLPARDDGGPGSLALSMIRSGSAAGTFTIAGSRS